MWLGHHRKIRPPGLFALYVSGYSAFRIVEESLRVDPSEHFLGLRLNMYVACVLTVAGLVWFWRSQRRGPAVPAGRAGDGAAEDRQADGGGTGTEAAGVTAGQGGEPLAQVPGQSPESAGDSPGTRP